MHPTLCHRAFSAFDSRAGHVCCVYQRFQQRKTYHSWAELNNSPEVQQLRSDLLSGKRNDGCQQCWHEEDQGFTSMRTSLSWPGDVQPGRLRSLVVDTGNACNLACRACSATDSSRHMIESRHRWPLQPVIDQRRGSNWSQLQALDFTDLAIIEVIGGEPLLNLDHLALLQTVIQQGHAHHVDVIYVTNCTNPLSATTAHMLRQFRSAKFNLSIDAVGRQFEYVRTGGQWLQVETTLHSIRQQLGDDHISVNPVVSALTVLYLDDLMSWCQHQGLPVIHMNMAYQPACYSMQLFTESQRQQIVHYLQDSVWSEKYQGIIREIVSCAGSPQARVEFDREVAWTEQYWGLALRDYLPALCGLIGAP